MMISYLILALFVGNAFSSAPASSSISGKIRGSFAFKDANDATSHGVSFDKNNNFVVGEKVVIEDSTIVDKQKGSRFLTYGIITSQDGQRWTVNARSNDNGKEYYDIRVHYSAQAIGKLPQVSSSQAAASSSSSASSARRVAPEASIRKFTKEELGRSLNDILAHVAFHSKAQAKLNNVSFDRNNNFARKELVVITDPSHGKNQQSESKSQIYGLVLGQKGRSNIWYVQIISDGNALYNQRPPEELTAIDIGKMLITPASIQQAPSQASASSSSVPAQNQAASMAPGGPAIEQEPGEEEQVEGRPNRAEGQIEGKPSGKK